MGCIRLRIDWLIVGLLGYCAGATQRQGRSDILNDLLMFDVSTSHHLFPKVREEINQALTSFYRFVLQKKGRSTTRAMKLLLERPKTPTKALSNTCTCEPKCWRIRVFEKKHQAGTGTDQKPHKEGRCTQYLPDTQLNRTEGGVPGLQKCLVRTTRTEAPNHMYQLTRLPNFDSIWRSLRYL